VKRHRTASLASCVGLTLLLVLSVGPSSAAAADIKMVVGNWEGTLDPGAQPKKRIVIHITAAQDGSLSGTIDYPDQDTSGILITAITYKEPALHFESDSNLSVFDGTMNKDGSEIGGTWKQGAKGLDLILKRTP
jgi:spermidine/putrescine-binding protein